MYDALKRQSLVKNQRTLKILGLDTWGQFELYWQAKIDTWNKNNPDDPITAQNVATDHIKPVNAFTRFKDGNPNHYTNLQPIPCHVNRAKSNKWQQIDEDFWQKNIYENPAFMQTFLPYDMSRDWTRAPCVEA